MNDTQDDRERWSASLLATNAALSATQAENLNQAALLLMAGCLVLLFAIAAISCVLIAQFHRMAMGNSRNDVRARLFPSQTPAAPTAKSRPKRASADVNTSCAPAPDEDEEDF
jgi:hypothetical protein